MQLGRWWDLTVGLRVLGLDIEFLMSVSIEEVRGNFVL